MRAAPPDLMIFLHIGKSAGTTFHALLKPHFAADEILMPQGPLSAIGIWPKDLARAAVSAMDESHRERIRFVSGHVPFGIHECFSKRAHIIMLMRDPVERILSGYSYSMEKMGAPPDTRPLAADLRASRNPGLDNVVTRILSDDPELNPSLETAYAGNWRRVTPLDFQKAKENLELHISICGLVEHFEQSVVLTEMTLGLRMADRGIPSLNVTKNRLRIEDCDPTLITELRTSNYYDELLYERVRQSFAAAKNAFGSKFSERLAEVQRLGP